jgi:hypothetical protein
MNLSLAHGIGQAASGFARGMQLGESIKTQRQNRQIQKAEHDEVQKQRAKQEEHNRLMQEWNAAGAKFLEGRRADAILNGADEKAWKPSHDDLLGAMDARGEAMFKAGRFEDYTKNFAEVEQARSGIRAKATQDALTAYQVSRDPTVLAGLWSQYSPGAKATGAERIQGPDGKPMVRFIVQGPDGKQTPQDVDEQELLMGLQGMAMNPAEAAKFAYQRSLENLKLKNELEKIRAQGERDQATNEGRHGLTLAEIAARTQGSLTVERERGAQSRATESIRGDRDNSRLLREERLSLQSRAAQLRNLLKDATNPARLFALDSEETERNKRAVEEMEDELRRTNEALRNLEADARASRGGTQPRGNTTAPSGATKDYSTLWK